MSWQLIVWNIFIWTFTGAMITLNHASLWWLIIPGLFTMWNNGSELMKKQEEEVEKLNKQLEELTRIAKRNERL
jgi:hypothetical protein